MISLHEGRGRKGRKKKPPELALTLLLNLEGCRPRIWRRIVVRETMWLSRLHDAIQIAFEWYDYQTHVFRFDELRLGNPVKSDGLMVEDDRDVTLRDLEVAGRSRFQYEYTFGDGWEVAVQVEKSAPVAKGTFYPVCLGGEYAGPPEDCGGVDAYHDMLASLAEPESDLGREWRNWVGADFDPKKFDLKKVNQALRKVRR